MDPGPRSIDDALRLAVQFHQAGKVREAEALYRQILTVIPDHPDALHLLGVLAGQVGQLDSGIDLIRRSLAVQPDSADAWGNLGRLLADRKSVDDAVSAYQRAVMLRPNDWEKQLALAICLRIVKQPEAALASFERAVRLNPASSEAHAGVARCYSDLGKSDQMIAAFRRVFALTGGSAALRLEFGTLLVAAERLDEGLVELEQAVQLEPANVTALLNTATVLRRIGKQKESAELFTRLAGLTPQDPEAHLRLGLVYFELNRFEDAKAAYDAAVALAPDNPRFIRALGMVQLARGDVVDAERIYRKVLELEPDSDIACNSLGSIFAARGQFEKASEFYRRSANRTPDALASRAQLAQITRLTEQDIAVLQARLADESLSHEDRAAAGFGLGKTYDDANMYDQAFDCFQQANDHIQRLLTRTGMRFQRSHLHGVVDSLIDRYGAKYFSRESGGISSDLPVFIVGMPRSGTTLVEQICASHSKVFGAGELSDIQEYRVELEAFYSGGQYAPGEVARVAARHLEKLTSLGGSAVRVIDKLPSNLLDLGVIATLFPRARVIFTERDPRDNCLSCYFQGFARNNIKSSYDLSDCAGQYLEQERLTAHWMKVLKLPWMKMSYEELVADLSGQSRRLIDFLGLEWEPACLDFHKTDRVVLTSSVWQVRQPIYTKSVGRWKHYEKHLAPLMAVLGQGNSI